MFIIYKKNLILTSDYRHWPIRDDIAARISTAVVRDVKRGTAPAIALQNATLAILNDPKTKADPLLWAPFAMIQ